MKCTEWKREHRKSGSHPWVRRCGSVEADIMLWKPGEYRVAIIERRRGIVQSVRNVYAKTLGAAKSAASRVMNRMAGR